MYKTVYNFQTAQRPNLTRVENEPPFIDDEGVERYELKELQNDIGSVLPSIGIIFMF